MKVTMMVDVDDEVRRAIASDALDYKDLNPKPADRETVTTFIKNVIRKGFTALLETVDEGGME